MIPRWRIRSVVLAALCLATAGGALLIKSRTGESSQAVLVVLAPSKHPQVVVESPTHDFGYMEIGAVRRHKFTVRNAGEADLTLAIDSTTCQCTSAKVAQEVVPPGGATQIELEWTAKDRQYRFRQSALLLTNDPRHKKIDLAVEGSVRTKLAAVPADPVFSDISRGKPAQTETAIYSEVFDDIQITKIESDLPGVTAHFTDERPDLGEGFDVRFCRLLVIRCTGNEKPGSFQGTVRLSYEATTRDGARYRQSLAVPFYGKVIGDITFQGLDVVGSTLNLGNISGARGARRKAFLHVRSNAADADQTATFAAALKSVTPQFFQIQIGAPQRLSATMTRLPIEVVVPPGSPASRLTDNTAAESAIVLTTTHPDYPTVKLWLSGVITP